jgi:glutamate/tyrosine decarboxylase-like PLP-dependent enzyme
VARNTRAFEANSDVTPAALRVLLGAARGLPEAGDDAAALLDEAASLLFEHSPPGGHPRFLGYVAAAPAPIGVLAELLAAALNANVALWRAAPAAAEIEAQTLRWLAELVGFPAAGGGLLTSGGNAANAIALHLALCARLPRFRDDGLDGAQLAVYASDQTHGWLHKAVEQAGLGTRALRWIASDARQRLRVQALADAIAADRAAGVVPLMAVGNAGTVGTGAVDPLGALAALCREHGLWLHVDGAYGAPAACLLGSPHAASLGDAAADLAALGKADSLALDPHKWLSAPIEAGGLLVRETGRLAHAYGRHRPSYYDPGGEAGVEEFEDEGDEAAGAAAQAAAGARAAPADALAGPDFYALGPQNTRGFRALKVWLALRMAGREGYRRIVADDIALARRLFERVAAAPGMEAVTRQLGVVTFRARPPGLDDPAALDALNRALLARLRREGEVVLSPAHVDGRFLLRACLVNFRTSAEDVDRVAARLAETAATLGS